MTPQVKIEGIHVRHLDWTQAGAQPARTRIPISAVASGLGRVSPSVRLRLFSRAVHRSVLVVDRGCLFGFRLTRLYPH